MFEKHSAVNLTTDETDLTDNYQVIIAARQDISAIRVIRVQEKIIRSIRTIRVQEKTLSGESEHESTELANHVDLPQGKSIRSIRQIRVPHRSIAPRFMPPLGWRIIESLTVLQHWIEKL